MYTPCTGGSFVLYKSTALLLNLTWTGPFALSQQMISKHIAYLVRARIVIKTKRGRESVCTLRPEAIKTVSDWAISYRRFWEESFDKLDVVVNRMKKEEVRDDKKHG